MSKITFETLCELKAELKIKKQEAFRVVTESMEPLIKTGQKILVEPLVNDPENFDILVFWNGRVLVSHYLWHENQIPSLDGERTFVTRALNGGGEDIPVKRSHVLGRVVSHTIAPKTKWKLILNDWFRRKIRKFMLHA